MGTQAPATSSSCSSCSALVGVSALVIANKPTKLGLDLKGGVELVYQGQPTGQVDGGHRRGHRTLDRDHPRADRPVRRLRARGLAPRHRPDHGQPARRRQRPAGDRPGRDDRPALLLRLGAEPDRSRAGDRRPPGPSRRKGRWKHPKNAGRKPAATRQAENQQLISPAPTRPPTARRSSPPNSSRPRTATNCSVAKPRYYLFEQGEPHELIAGPELRRKGPLHQPDRRRTPAATGSSSRCRRARSSSPNTRPTQAAGRRDRASPAGTRSRTTRRSRAPTSPIPKQDLRAEPTNRTSPSASPTTAATPSRRSPARSPSAARRRRFGPVSGEQAEALSGHFAVVLDNEVETRPIINFAENPDGIDGRTGPRSPAASRASGGPGPGRRSCRSAPCRSTSS